MWSRPSESERVLVLRGKVALADGVEQLTFVDPAEEQLLRPDLVRQYSLCGDAVVDGVPDHRDSLLDEDERAAFSERLVLDL